MATLYPRHSFSSRLESTGRSGWDFCMSKAYCKWPVIAAIVIGVVVICLSLYCFLRCCGCLGRGRNRKNKQSFLPAPYQGYQPANSNIAPPGAGPGPAQYAQFDSHHTGYGGRKITEDSLPHMPSWQDARETRIEDHNRNHQDSENVELGSLQKPALASTAHLPPPQYQQHQQQPPQSPLHQHDTGVTEVDSTPVHPAHRAPSPYTGPDFSAADQPTHHQQQLPHLYTGPDFSTPSHTGYSAYTPSESTRYEPSSQMDNGPQELGTTYSNTAPPAPHNNPHGTPTALQPGKNWRDI